MKAGRIRIWKFAAAPGELRALHRGPKPPEWVVIVPREMQGSDIENLLLAQGPPGSITRHATGKGDFVYLGQSGVSQVSKLLASRGRIRTEKLLKGASRNRRSP